MVLFVWDFHGVLEIGNEKFIGETVNQVLQENGFKTRISVENMRLWYGIKLYEYFERLVPDENKNRHISLQALCREKMTEDALQSSIRATPFAHDVLSMIAKNSSDQILISNTSDSILDRYLRIVTMKPYFTHIFPTNIPGQERTKTQVLCEYLQHNPPKKVVIIGDAPSDMELSQVNCTIPTRTYHYVHPGWEHRECSSDYKINDLREILQELGNI